jgi:hypothetical protein
MALNPRLEEEKLATELAKIRQTTRMRLGIVAGIIIIGVLQTNFPDLGGSHPGAVVGPLLRAAMPLAFLAAAGVLVVVGLARRDMKRAEAAFESKVFRVPKRKKRPD